MYVDLKTEDRELFYRLLAEMCESAEPVQITLNKRDGLYRLEAVCKSEPVASSVI